jgi:hypothetical protein
MDHIPVEARCILDPLAGEIWDTDFEPVALISFLPTKTDDRGDLEGTLLRPEVRTMPLTWWCMRWCYRWQPPVLPTAADGATIPHPHHWCYKCLPPSYKPRHRSCKPLRHDCKGQETELQSPTELQGCDCAATSVMVFFGDGEGSAGWGWREQ